MSFTSIPFLWFLAAFLTLYGLCPATYRRYLLLLGSFVFIAMESLAAAAIALLFAGLNYGLGICIQRTERRTLVLGMAISIDVLFMATFKLANIVTSGFSFYLFAFIAYLVEIYRSTIQAETDPIRFASYSFFFPKFTMGPITRYSEMADQLDKPRINAASFQKGLEDFTLGFVLKILVCDRLGILFSSQYDSTLCKYVKIPYDDLLQTGYEYISTDLAWFGALVASLHIYLEWISYMYMAIGLAYLLGFKLPQNFNYPYTARTVGDYYRRWHMTLTRWFKDFIYIPLGGSRRGLSKTIVNVLFVWLLTSLWHGNGLAGKYVLWGIAAGAAMLLDPICYNKITNRSDREPDLSLRILGHLPLLLLVLVSILVLRKPASGYNFILWGMSIGVLIVLERLWKTFVVERFHFGARFGKTDLLGKTWKLLVSLLAHIWVVVTMVLSWVVFSIKDYDKLKLYFSRLFPAAGASAGVIENDLSLRWDKLGIYVLIAVLFCFPVVDRGIRLLKRTKYGTWIVSAILAGLFWYAIYILNTTGSNPMGYAQF